MKHKDITIRFRNLRVYENGRIDRLEFKDTNGHRHKQKELCPWISNCGYSMVSLSALGLLVHRLVAMAFLTAYRDYLEVDHRDGDKQNNWRHNLRMATHRQNSRAYISKQESCTSIFRGVHWAKDRSKWRASCFVGGKHNHIGSYETEKEAAEAYNKFAKKHGYFPEALNKI